jgi:uncharacterized SAM-binding protein YcdF (DUF218 family)
VFFFLSKILDILLTPLAWSVGLLVVGRLCRATSRARRVLPALGLFVLLFFSLEPVSNRLWRAVESPPLRTQRPGVTYDVVILLGGMVDERVAGTWGELSMNDYSDRLLRTFDLLRTGAAKNAILSAGSIPGTSSESYALRDQLVAWGVAPERIVVEDRSRNTHENALFSAEIVRARCFHDVLIVTSAFHMRRAYGCFEAEGLPVDTSPVDFRSYADRYPTDLLPRAEHLAQSSAALREAFGRVVYRLRGYSR